MHDPNNATLDGLAQALAQLPGATLDGVAGCISVPGQEAVSVPPDDVLRRLSATPHLVCHAPFLVRRMGFIARAEMSDQRAALAPRHLDIAEVSGYARQSNVN